ncbi:unnamed protein product [Lepeophtheirus salmonis]|uniref:(salmon louse) hypothetical protein n=1 Tax=Lepeophtheirus salmonis TaxID=72036 RepID=A0A7R8CSK8_LEPSM|nr:unnamed protein product [Lepeophtheirus salmonis]CAF2917063.1 unnamed protein product [Lepeophtheirus salmonis]
MTGSGSKRSTLNTNSFQLVKLRDLFVELELVEGVKELEVKKKTKVAIIVREYLIACGRAPKTQDFSTNDQILVRSKEGFTTTLRLKRSTAMVQDIKIYQERKGGGLSNHHQSHVRGFFCQGICAL